MTQTSAQRRDKALAQVDAAADPAWKEEAYDFLVKYLKKHPSMFVDDLWDAGLRSTREDRALGPIFRRAAKDGLMIKSSVFRPSVRSNMTEKPVWTSLIYR